MQIVVLANESLKEELLSKGVDASAEVHWVSELSECSSFPAADAFIDLLFENEEERVKALAALSPAMIAVNSVEHTLEELDHSFIRINAWDTFLQAPIIEAAGMMDVRQQAEKVFALFHKQIEWLPDEPGFVSARVVSMIINEAFLALEEGVSSREEINIAMKLGTNYPYGPFEWVEKTGLYPVASLLQKLFQKEKRYQPSSLLLQMATSTTVE